MKKLILLAAMVVVSISLSAQQKVALQHNGVTSIFSSSNPFLDAYNASVTGDTIYLPGGNIPFPSTIDKGLVILGVGHYPDSTQATNKTVLNGTLTINANADNLHLEGIEFTGTISFGTNLKVDNVLIKRCRLVSIVYNGTGAVATRCENNTITGNVITGNITFTNSFSCMLTNNIINGEISGGSSIGIANNIFLSNGTSYIINNVDNSSITNNVFFQKYHTSYVHNYCDLSTFSYNIFSLIPSIGNNTFESNNWYSVDMATVFVNQTGNLFDYTHNYHLVNPANYLDAVATQIGIYGGVFPYKTGAVPMNPHIQTKTISTQTNAAGEINVNIKVGAQNI